MKKIVRVLLCLIVLAFLKTHIVYGQLPQDHAYQKTLRKYLGTLTEEDFEIKLKPLVYRDSYFKSADDLYKLWLIRYNRGRRFPSSKGLRVKASNFTLSSIEAGGRVNMAMGRYGFFDPIGTAWYAQWDYAGNPYYQSKAVQLRAFVGCAVDVMMMDQAHEQGRLKRTDFFGSQLIWLGFVYKVVKSELPANVQDAYETGLRKLFSDLLKQGPVGIHADMDTFAMVGLWYIAKSIGDPQLISKARTYCRNRVFGNYEKKQGLYHPAGFIDYGGGFDPSYQGISMYFSIWAALVSGDPILKQRVDDMSKLKAYLSLPEPVTEPGKQHHFFSPSNFATGTTSGSARDQWGPYFRDVGAAMLSDEAKYLLWGGRSRLKWEKYGMRSPAQMRSRIVADMKQFNTTILTKPSTASPEPWNQIRDSRWTNGINYAVLYYKDGFYKRMRQLQQQHSPLTKAPFQRKKDFIKNFDDTFLSAKIGDYGVIIHTGDLSWWGDEQNIAGLGGGSLSAFWTPKSGSVILGQKAGYSGYNSKDPDVWGDWRQWPTHAISGENAGSKPFSSARQKHPQKNYHVYDTDSARVEVSGSLSGSFPAPNGALKGKISYKRTFRVRPDRLQITSWVHSDGRDQIGKLYEMIPVLINRDYWENKHADTKIDFKIDGRWQQAGTSAAKATAVRLVRDRKPIYITFNKPRSVKLSPKVWSTSYMLKSRQRNIMVDMLASGNKAASFSRKSVSYTISTSEHLAEIDSQRPSGGSTTAYYQEGWNLVSLPANLQSKRFKDVYSDIVYSTINTFEGTYSPITANDKITPGQGYWIKFSSPQKVTYKGPPLNSVELELRKGWNLIGGLSHNTDLGADMSDPQKLVSGVYETIDDSSTPDNYSLKKVTTLKPGKAYYLKAKSKGTISLSVN